MPALGVLLGVAAAVCAAPQQETEPAQPAPQPAAKDLPAAEGILKMAIEAMGGQKAFDAIESSYIKSTMAAMGFSIQFDMYTAEPDKLFVRQIVPGVGDGLMGMNGDAAWRKQPMQDYQLLEAKELVDMSDQAHLFEIVPQLEKQYAMMQTVDRVEFAGQDCYKIRLSGKKNAKPEEKDAQSYALFNADTHLAAALQNVQPAREGMPERTSALRFEDWKEIGDLKLYTKLVIVQNSGELTMSYDEIKFNEVDESVFAVPDEVKKLLEERQAAEAATEEGEDDAAGVSQQTKDLLEKFLKQDDPAQLRMVVGLLESKVADTPEPEKANMEYIIRKLKERIEELEGGDEK